MKPISKGTVNMLYILYTHVKIICYMQMTSDEATLKLCNDMTARWACDLVFYLPTA